MPILHNLFSGMQLSPSQSCVRRVTCFTASLSPRNSPARSCTRIASIQSKRETEQTADSVTSAGKPLNPEKELVESGGKEAKARQNEDMTAKDIGEQLSSLRSDNGDTGLLQGVLEETKLISWPAPLQAVKDTVTVVAVVALAAVLLFGLNTGLTEGSKLLYSIHFR